MIGAIVEAIGEVAKAAAKEGVAEHTLETVEQSVTSKFSDFQKQQENLSDAVLDTRVEAAAHSASKFFDLPDAEIQKGDAIGVYKNGEGAFVNDVFEYNLDQFKDMNCTSFEDMTKVWTHECGHRILQDAFPNPWAEELGADFFAGARSEMIGLPKSNFEKMLGSTDASISHPDGVLRMKAMDYGRDTVAQMKKEGIQPTWENCLDAYKESPFAQMEYENEIKSIVPNTKQIETSLKVENKQGCLTDIEKKEIKKQTGWSSHVVDAIRTIEEAQVYINAGLIEGKINGKSTLLQPQIKGDAINDTKFPNICNKVHAEQGRPPRDVNGRPYELHHIGQNPESPLAELTCEQHRDCNNFKILHTFDESSIDRIQFKKEREKYWSERSKTL